MASVQEHYQLLLAPVYLWMAGGADAALHLGQTEIDALHLPLPADALVVDLGAGFGAHSIALAKSGFRVVAIDSSAQLLQTLDDLRGQLPMQVVHDDLLAFPTHLKEKPAAVFCMGDTLTHLPSRDCVDRLFREVAGALAAGGHFVLSFRDYTQPFLAEQRFIPVRSDDQRILICFLEYGSDVVTVHDILTERFGAEWRTRVSAYKKLRLSPDDLVDQLSSLGFQVRREPGLRGLVRLVARRA